jgi:hypothetical protein
VRSVAHLDILGDTPLTRHVVALSAVLLGVGIVGQIFLVVMRGWGMGVGAWLAFYVVATVVALPIHELVHAAAFLLGMLYTRAEGEPLARGLFVAVLLAPSVLVTAALAVLGNAVAGPALGWALAWTHLSGCAGDLAMIAGIARTPGCTHVRDTDTGVELLANDGEGDGA